MSDIQPLSFYEELPGFPMYRFCADGSVLSLKLGRYLKPLPVKNGYRHVVLCNDDGHHRLSVHRLIARAFIGEPFHGAVINHKDGNRANNHYTNLEWVTQSENVNHAYKNGRRVINAQHRQRCAALGRAKRKTTDIQEQQILAMWTGKRGDLARISRAMKLTRDIVSRVLESR